MQNPSKCISRLSILTPLYFSIFLHHLTTTISSKSLAPYSPVDNVVLNCGASGNSTALDGREWIGDIGSKFASSLELNNTSIASIDRSVPYMAARIFRSQFTYTFRVTPGQKFIRLYFYPASYLGFDRSKAFFSVKAGPYTLLSNFSPSHTADSLGLEYFVKEFCINIETNQPLNITFAPSTTTSDDVYAFINGIEILSMPTNLYYTSSGDLGVPLIGQQSLFPIDNNTALEMVHRLNVGGRSISPINDSGLFRGWSNDTTYSLGLGGVPVNMTIQIRYTRVPTYTAPKEVYQTARSMGLDKEVNKRYNLTWKLPVDSGFKYLVRLHFCEFQPEITKIRDKVFYIYINNQTAEDSANVIRWSRGKGIPVYKDYAVMIESEGIKGKRDLFIALHPKAESRIASFDAFLNGVEVFKLNNSDGNLTSTNPHPVLIPAPMEPSSWSDNKSKIKKTLFMAVGRGMIIGAIALSLLGFIVFRLWMKTKSQNTKVSLLQEELCRHFTLAEIETATNHFDKALIIGKGGFGRVYKGYIDGGHTPVAIKRLKPTSLQGAREFWTEIKMLSTLRHLHLVSLIGYCTDERKMILVYDYMAQGTLREHLYKSYNPPLSWKRRLEICIGAARGLEFLHAGAEHKIIHRDVKTTNILLDENWVAKVSDFGLSRMGPTSASRSHVTTDVKGTFGYLDPEYFWSHHLTEKSDVYALGVVLFEVLCARAAVDMELEDEEQYSLSQWAQHCLKNGTLDQIIDPYLTGKIAPECLKVFTVIADKCLRDGRKERPEMRDVVRSLEFALELQESADAAKEGVKIGGANRVEIDERMWLSRGGNQVGSRPSKNGGLIHSCPTFWQKSISRKALFRFFSDKAKWASSPKFSCRLKKSCFTGSATKYDGLPSDQGNGSDLRTIAVQMTAVEVSSEINKLELRITGRCRQNNGFT